MRWIFWRRTPIRDAERALQQSRDDRPRVQALARDLTAKRAVNNFAPLVNEAFRRRNE